MLEECGDDLDSAIRSLNDLRLGSAENFSAAADKSDVIDESNVPAQGTHMKTFGMLKVLSWLWIGWDDFWIIMCVCMHVWKIKPKGVLLCYLPLGLSPADSFSPFFYRTSIDGGL